jgi:hypothetical protein
VSGQQKTFNTAEWYDYPLAFVVVAVLAFIGSQLVQVIGFFTILFAPVAGVVIGEAARIVIRRRRSKRLFQIATAGVIIGCLPVLLSQVGYALLTFSQIGFGGFGSLLSLLWIVLYVIIVTSTVYYRLSGIKIRY